MTQCLPLTFLTNGKSWLADEAKINAPFLFLLTTLCYVLRSVCGYIYMGGLNMKWVEFNHFYSCVPWCTLISTILPITMLITRNLCFFPLKKSVAKMLHVFVHFQRSGGNSCFLLREPHSRLLSI